MIPKRKSNNVLPSPSNRSIKELLKSEGVSQQFFPALRSTFEKYSKIMAVIFVVMLAALGPVFGQFNLNQPLPNEVNRPPSFSPPRVVFGSPSNQGQQSFQVQQGGQQQFGPGPQDGMVFDVRPAMAMPFPSSEPARAIAVLRPPPGSNENINGTVEFRQMPGQMTRIIARITGMPPNSTRGLHVHQFGDMSNGCASMGDHYNPFNMTHGGPLDDVRHIGDIGNIVADARGTAVLDMQDFMITLHGLFGIGGRGVVLHSGRDDLGRGGNSSSLATGNAGTRVACGVVVFADPRSIR